jgi:PHD/YefM family antitoxin component YafN of YafNO toxin-antitoxin module
MMNVNITNFRKDIYKLLDNTIKYNEPINISTKNGNAVVISEQDYRDLIATLEVYNNPKLKKIIKDGLEESIEDCIEEDEEDYDCTE